MMFRFAGSALLAAVLLAACGGDDGDGLPPAASAEGVWTGKTSTGHDVGLLVLETGETWGLFSGASLYALYGNTVSSHGELTGSGRKFNLRSGATSASSYSGMYTAKNTLRAQLSDGSTFEGVYDPGYDQPASLAALAGTYQASGTAVTITASGAVSITASSSFRCDASGSVTPRASGKNVFDLRITFSGANCALGNNTTASGAAYQRGGNSLIAMGLLPSQQAGFFFAGNK
jgi:hypothetical protein